MKVRPLEKVARVDFQVITAVVQSLIQAEIGRHHPLVFPVKTPQEFAELRWESIACTEEMLSLTTRRFADMFHVDVPTPALNEKTGAFADRGLALWRESEHLLTFFTSGSTGAPKACTHPESHVRQEVAHYAPLAADRKAVLVTTPIYTMYGFTFGLLLPLSLGIPIRSLPPLATVVDARMLPGDLVISVPLLWSQMTKMHHWRADRAASGRDVTILTAAYPMPPEVIQTLRRHGFRMWEVYGSSETGGVCLREDPDEPFHLLPHMRRGQGEHEDALERLLPDGTLMRLLMPDNIIWLGDRTLIPGGRLDETVQVAGIKVHPGHVASVLETHEGVARCSVRLMRPDEGFRLKAFIVPEPGRDERALRASLTRFARKHLDSAQRPAHYTFGEDIPRGPMGKPADW